MSATNGNESDHSSNLGEKAAKERLQTQENVDVEKVRTFERVGTHAEYYEKDGLRTEGDGVDHDGTYHTMTPKLFVSLVAMSFLWVGSQIPLYLFGGVLPDIYSDIGGYEIWIWFVIGYLIPNAALCPFVGSLSDMFGRRYVGIGGQLCLIVGPIITATANTMLTAVGGQVLSGVGAGLNELISVAATGEMVPTNKRGLYVGGVVFTILPFAPSVLWAQLIVGVSSWRWIGAFVAGWNFVGLIMVAFLYFPPPRPNVQGYSKVEILKRIDYVGAFLSIGGVLFFLLGMQNSIQQYEWTDAGVLAPVIIGLILCIAFFVWEMYFAKYPMVPHRIFAKAKKDMIIILLITTLSGANFFNVLLFWPTEIYNVYGKDRIGIGLRSLPIGFGILTGAVLSLVAIPLTKGRIREIMIFATALMTAGVGAMSIARPDNIGATIPVVTIACIGVGAVIIPCSLIAQIICPDDLIATVTAITLSVRYVGGAIGFTIYYNIFFQHAHDNIKAMVATDVIVGKIGYAPYSVQHLRRLALAVAHAKYDKFEKLCRIAANSKFILYHKYKGHPEEICNLITEAAQEAFALAYQWPYWISIAFGSTCFFLSFFLTNINSFLDAHIAVVM